MRRKSLEDFIWGRCSPDGNLIWMNVLVTDVI